MRIPGDPHNYGPIPRIKYSELALSYMRRARERAIENLGYCEVIVVFTRYHRLIERDQHGNVIHEDENGIVLGFQKSGAVHPKCIHSVSDLHIAYSISGYLDTECLSVDCVDNKLVFVEDPLSERT